MLKSQQQKVFLTMKDKNGSVLFGFIEIFARKTFK